MSGNKIVVHRYGVDLKRFAPSSPKLDNKIPILLTVARLVEKKGIEYSLRAFASIRNGCKAEYRIIGEGPLRTTLEQLSHKLGCANRVHFLGPKTKEDVIREMGKADIFVLASLTASDGDTEGLPVSLIEAHAMELPVLSTLHSGIPELVMDGETGYLVPEKDVARLAERMQALIQSRELRETFSQKARARVESDFNIETLNDTLKEMLLYHHGTPASQPVSVEDSKEENIGVECPVCGGNFKEFLPYGYTPRPNALCPGCRALERHRLLWLFLERRTNFFSKKAKVLDIAPSHALAKRYAGLPNIDYLSVDLSSPLAMRHMDITHLELPDNAFDVVLCYHVLEHIQDDGAAMKELSRVLKPGGWAILQVPLDPGLEKTHEGRSISDPEERARLFGQPDHYRKYGLDYKDRLQAAGFSVQVDPFASTLSSRELSHYGIQKSEDIYFCSKAMTNMVAAAKDKEEILEGQRGMLVQQLQKCGWLQRTPLYESCVKEILNFREVAGAPLSVIMTISNYNPEGKKKHSIGFSRKESELPIHPGGHWRSCGGC